MGLTLPPSASVKEVLEQLVQLAEHLSERDDDVMERLEQRLQRCVNAGIMARMPYAKMVGIFEDLGLGEEEVLAMESVMGDGDIFPRQVSHTLARRPARDDDAGRRGGEQTMVLPHLPKRRVTATDINDYHHPLEFYNLPGTA